MKFWCIAMAVALFLGCGGSEPQPDEGVTGQMRGDVRAELVEAMEWFAADTVAVAAFSTSAFWDHARDWFPKGQEQRFDAMRADLSGICKRELGVDLTMANTVVIGGGPQGVAAVLRGPVELPPGSDPVRELDANFVMVPTGDGGAALFDSRAEADAALRARESGATLADQELPLEMLDAVGATRAVGFVRATDAIEQQIAAFTPPPEYAVLSLGERIVATIRGSEESLDKISRLVEHGLQLGQDEFANDYERRDQLPALEAAAAVFGYHYSDAYLDSIQSTRDNGELRYTARLPSGAVGIASPGIMAAIAIPAFLRYLKASKAAEAEQVLQMFAQGARIAFDTTEEPLRNRTFPGGTNGEFVSSIEIPTGGKKIDSNPVVSETSTLQPDELLRMLNVTLPEKTYFHYHYHARGTGDAARVRITATADFTEGGPAHQMFVEVVVDPESGAAVVTEPSVVNEFE